jgi:hypothetical protein
MQKVIRNAARPEMGATESADALSVLRELFEILQDYAPIWYNEELHNRAASALGEMVLEPVS